jgi:hypothetical protein
MNSMDSNRIVGVIILCGLIIILAIGGIMAIHHQKMLNSMEDYATFKDIVAIISNRNVNVPPPKTINLSQKEPSFPDIFLTFILLFVLGGFSGAGTYLLRVSESNPFLVHLFAGNVIVCSLSGILGLGMVYIWRGGFDYVSCITGGVALSLFFAIIGIESIRNYGLKLFQVGLDFLKSKVSKG